MAESARVKSKLALFDPILILAVCVLAYSGYLIARDLLPDYQTVEGTILKSATTYTQSPPRPPTAHSEILFQYLWAGKMYKSDNYTHGGRDAAKGVCLYKVGDKVNVFVDPSDPDDAVLAKDTSGFVFGLGLIGIMMLGHRVATLIHEHRHGATARLPASLIMSGRIVGLSILIGPLGYLVWLMLMPDC